MKQKLLLFIAMLILRGSILTTILSYFPDWLAEIILENLPGILQSVAAEFDINTAITSYLVGSSLHRQPQYAAKAVIEKQIPKAREKLLGLLK